MHTHIMPPAKTRTLSTAEDRRESILRAAVGVFAKRGLHGTPTTEIAKAAGISQAYLFRLFPTKLELFVELVRRCNDRVYRTFEDAATHARRDDEDVLEAMGRAYVGLLADRDVLLVQLHAHAASDEPAIREQMRAGFGRVVQLVHRESGAEPEAVRAFMATGMLLNVLSTMRAQELDAPWTDVIFAGLSLES